MTVRSLYLAQGSPEWLAARRTRYGASETPQIAGLTGSAARVWRSKLDRAEELDALYLELGHVLEPWALRLWGRATGRDIEPGAVLAEEGGLLLASLDGASRGEPVEAKARLRGSPDWDAWAEDAIPGGVEVQVRQQAHLAEGYLGARLEAAHVSAILLDGWSVEHRVYRVELTPERRDQWADVWVPYIHRWHTHYILGRRPPPDATAQDVAVLVEPIRVRRREATPEEAALVAQLIEAEAARKTAAAAEAAATKARDAIKGDLARRIGPDSTIPGLRWQPIKGQKPRLNLE
jgi:hypothetical protein